MTISNERRLKIYEYLDLPMDKRMHITEFRKSLHISGRTLRNIKFDWEADRKTADRIARDEAKARKKLGDDLYGVKIEYDSKTFLKSRSREVDEALIEACKAGNANALKVYKQILGELVEKSPVEVKIYNATDHYNAYRDAQDRVSKVRGGTPGGISLLPRPPILPDPVCVDSEQEHSEDS